MIATIRYPNQRHSNHSQEVCSFACKKKSIWEARVQSCHCGRCIASGTLQTSLLSPRPSGFATSPRLKPERTFESHMILCTTLKLLQCSLARDLGFQLNGLKIMNNLDIRSLHKDKSSTVIGEIGFSRNIQCFL